MPLNSAFFPTGKTVAITATTTASTAVQVPAAAGESLSHTYWATNAGPSGVFLAADMASTTTAVIPVDGTPANGRYLPSGASMLVVTGAWFSAITASSTATVYIVPGDAV